MQRKENQCRLSLSQQWELSTKLLLNAVSTGAHVLKGKIYRNHMIDVQVTNSKLYCRATRLLQVYKMTRFMGHKEDLTQKYTYVLFTECIHSVVGHY